MSTRDIDDPSKRKKYKEKKFNGKKSTQDEYSKKKIYKQNKPNAKRKHSTSTLSEVDHVVTLSTIKTRYADLTPEQQKKIANMYTNYALTNTHLNRSKRNLENHEYIERELKKSWEQLQKKDFQAAKQTAADVTNVAPDMLCREVVSNTIISSGANVYRSCTCSQSLPASGSFPMS